MQLRQRSCNPPSGGASRADVDACRHPLPTRTGSPLAPSIRRTIPHRGHRISSGPSPSSRKSGRSVAQSGQNSPREASAPARSIARLRASWSTDASDLANEWIRKHKFQLEDDINPVGTGHYFHRIRNRQFAIRSVPILSRRAFPLDPPTRVVTLYIRYHSEYRDDSSGLTHRECRDLGRPFHSSVEAANSTHTGAGTHRAIIGVVIPWRQGSPGVGIEFRPFRAPPRRPRRSIGPGNRGDPRAAPDSVVPGFSPSEESHPCPCATPHWPCPSGS
jgi:hypothetical protein